MITSGTHDLGKLHIDMVMFQFATLVYPLVICYIAIKHSPSIVDLPRKDGDVP